MSINANLETMGTNLRVGDKAGKLLACMGAVLVLSLTLSLTPGVHAPGTSLAAYADNPIGSITYQNGSNSAEKTFTDFKTLKQELEKHKNEKVRVDMLCDWTASDGTITERLKIPSGSATTMYMHGYMIDREMTRDNKFDWDGEVIDVESGAIFELVGGEGDENSKSHAAYVYRSTDRDKKAGNNETIRVAGGLITGGGSWDGAGGIHIKKGSTVTLKNVTIAGCRSQQKKSKNGDGGGIYLDDGSITLNLENSTITGCFAYNDGGGIYADDHDSVSISLVNSHIDGNFANSDGGGINPDGTNATIKGDGNSTVSNNECGSRGGGILTYNSGCAISNLELKGNKGGEGGAIYAYNPAFIEVYDKSAVKGMQATLENLVIDGNTASSKGGGIYVRTGGNIITGCKVENNTAPRAGGVYVYEDVDMDFAIKGKTTIKNNTASDGSDFKNLYISDNHSDNTHVSFKLKSGSEVWMSYYDSREHEIVVTPEKVKDTDCAKYIHSDQYGYYYTYESSQIKRKSGYQPDPVQPTLLTPADTMGASARESNGTNAGKVGTVGVGGSYPGDGPEFDKIRMFYGYASQENASVVYYSDGLFYENPMLYNEHLATASWALAFAGGYLDKDEESYAYKNKSYNKHAAARQFLADLGCPDDMIYVNDDNAKAPKSDTIGVTIGSKELAYADGTKTGDILVPVTVRGLGYGMEWMSNVTIGKTGEASGFSSAASKVVESIEYYLQKYKLEDAYKAGRVKFWITGYSRSGATANLTSKRLIEKIANDCQGEKKSQVFCYTCEAPKGGTDESEQLEASNYFCIHNMINKVDIVPYVAPEQMGFKRYGVDHYIPGSSAYYYNEGMMPADWDFATVSVPGTNKGVHKYTRKVIRTGAGKKTVTTYADNLYVSTKTSAYENRRGKMLDHLAAIDPTLIFDDYFQPMVMSFIPMATYKKGNYDGNTAEAFVEDFINFVQVAWLGSSRIKSWYQPVSDRGYYVDGGVQNLARTLMNIAYDENGLAVGEISTDDLDIPLISWADSGLFSGKKSLFALWDKCIEGWTAQTNSQKETWYSYTWDLAQDLGVLDELNDSQRSQLYGVWDKLIDRVFTFVCADDNTVPTSMGYIGSMDSSGKKTTWVAGAGEEEMMYTPTLMEHASYIISCHLPQVNIAWARTYDNWYANETAFYHMILQNSVAAPSAYAVSTKTGAKTKLVAGENEMNSLLGDQLVTFDVEGTVGEAIYYRIGDELYDGEYYQWLNRGGRSFNAGRNGKETWKVTVYAMSYGKKSAVATYNLALYDDTHEITVAETDTDTVNSQSLTAIAVQGAASQGSDGAPLAALSLQGLEAQAAAYRYREITAREGERVTISLPDELKDSKYYEAWKLELCDEAGNVLADVTDKLDYRVDSDGNALSFTMPEASESDGGFPYGYRLKVTIDYGDECSSGTMEVAAPVAGVVLQESVVVAFNNGKSVSCPIEWEYTNTYHPAGAAEGVTYTEQAPASGEAYQEADYSATVRIPADLAKGIAFARSVRMELTGGGTFSNGSTTAEIDRWSYDGVLYIYLKFPQTGAEGGQSKPTDGVELEVDPIDMNTGQQCGLIKRNIVEKGRDVTISAPTVELKRFMYWESDVIPIPDEMKREPVATFTIPSDLEVGQGLILRACYAPIITKLDVKVAAPVAGEPMATAPEHFRITVAGEYEVDPEFVELSWLPASSGDGDATQPQVAQALTEYTAAVKLKPKTDGSDGGQSPYIMATKVGEGAEPVKLDALFLYASDLEVVASAESDEQTARIVSATCDTDQESATANTVFATFAASTYELDGYRVFDNIYDVAHGATEDDIRAMLPKTTYIVTTTGIAIDVDITWEELVPRQASDDPRSACSWRANGTIELPDGVINTKFSDLWERIYIYVNEADQALPPTASLKSGEYLYNQVTALSAGEQGGTTYYTVDGSDPRSSGTRQVYAGESIYVSRDANTLVDETEAVMGVDPESGLEVPTGDMTPTGRKAFVVKAYTIVDGKWDSSVAEYEYVFSNEVPIPESPDLVETGAELVGVDASPFYTVKSVSEGARINEDGEAVATVQGSYTAELEIADGYVWSLPEYEDFDLETGLTAEGKLPRHKTTRKNQIVEFTIDPPVPLFRTHSILLDGRIGVKFYMNLSALTEEEKQSSYMTFEVAGRGGFTATDPFDESDMNPSGTYYGFTCYVNSIQMADKITPTFHCNGFEDVTDYPYSVADYVEFIEGNAESFAGAGESGMATLALVRSLADYGHYVQPFLAASRGWAVGADYAAMPAASELAGSTAHAFAAADVDAAAAAATGKAVAWTLPDGCGVEDATQSLKLDTGTDVVLYFKMEGGASVVSATVDGEAAVPVLGADGRWAVTVPNIPAQELGLDHAVAVKTSTGATVKAKVSALSYVSALFASDTYRDNVVARNAATSLYRYWDAAVKYLRATSEDAS